MKFLWISGWAVPPAWLAEQAQAVWPGHEHVAVSPSMAKDALSSETFDVLGGYSLGALWLLCHAPDVPKNISVILLAPFFAFPAESGCGGRIALAQLRLQRRRLRRDAVAALADFFLHAGLDKLEIPVAADELTPGRIAALDEELGWLENLGSPAPPPKNWIGVVGDNDPLLDADGLKKLWPAVQVLAGASHAPAELLRAAAGISRGILK